MMEIFIGLPDGHARKVFARYALGVEIRGSTVWLGSSGTQCGGAATVPPKTCQVPLVWNKATQRFDEGIADERAVIRWIKGRTEHADGGANHADKYFMRETGEEGRPYRVLRRDRFPLRALKLPARRSFGAAAGPPTRDPPTRARSG